VQTLNSGVARQKPTNHLDRAHKPKVVAPRVGNACRHAPPSLPTGTFSGKRTQPHIQASGPAEREQYQTRPPAPDREKEKDMLARRFEMGREAAMKLEAAELELQARARRGEALQPSQPAKTREVGELYLGLGAFFARYRILGTDSLPGFRALFPPRPYPCRHVQV